jgi:hypothetical protein
MLWLSKIKAKREREGKGCSFPYPRKAVIQAFNKVLFTSVKHIRIYS